LPSSHESDARDTPRGGLAALDAVTCGAVVAGEDDTRNTSGGLIAALYAVAWVLVIADEEVARLTDAQLAAIGGGARIAIAAGDLVWGELAPSLGDACVVRAWVTVIADEAL
jgi:hypothetical protein